MVEMLDPQNVFPQVIGVSNKKNTLPHKNWVKEDLKKYKLSNTLWKKAYTNS